MNRQQIAQLYDSFPEDQQDIPKPEFIRRTLNALDPAKMAKDAGTIVQGRVQKAQIDAAIRESR